MDLDESNQLDDEIKRISPKKATYIGGGERKAGFIVAKDDSGLLDHGAHVVSE